MMVESHDDLGGEEHGRETAHHHPQGHAAPSPGETAHDRTQDVREARDGEAPDHREEGPGDAADHRTEGHRQAPHDDAQGAGQAAHHHSQADRQAGSGEAAHHETSDHPNPAAGAARPPRHGVALGTAPHDGLTASRGRRTLAREDDRGGEPATPPIQVRRAHPDEVDAAAEIVEDAISWAGERSFASWPPGSFGPDREGRDRLRPALEAGDLYLILVNGETAGTLSLLREDRSFWPGAPADALYLHGFAVRGSHTGKGIGSAAIAWAAEEARRRGRRFLRLDCLAENPGIRTYYERAGFEHRADTEIHGTRFALYEWDLSDDGRPLRSSSPPMSRARALPRP